MNALLKYSISIFFLFVLHSGYGQGKFVPTNLRVGYDLSSLVNTLSNTDKTYFEITADVDFYRYFLTVDYGYQERTRMGEDFLYNNQGSYFRIGPDVNFNHNDRKNSALFLGLRYARSSFMDEMEYTIQDDVFGPVSGFQSNEKVNAQWMEIVSGLKVRIWQQLFLGYTVRFKLIKSQDVTDSLAPFDIPGYGKVQDKNSFGFNYYMYYRFKLREEKLPEKDKKLTQ